MSTNTMSPREVELYDGAIHAGNLEPTGELPDPYEPTEVETELLLAVDHFRAGRQCAGWDAMDRAEALLGERRRRQ